MDDLTTFKCLCNPLEIGIWKLDILLQENNQELLSLFEQEDEFLLGGYLEELLIWLIDNKNKELPASEKKNFTQLLKNVNLVKSDESRSRIPRYGRRLLNKIGEEEADKGSKLEDKFKAYLPHADSLKGYFLVQIDKFSRESGFIHYKTGDFFRIINGFDFGEDLSVISYDKSPLEIIEKVINQIAPSIKCKISKIYSPEDLVFLNYPYLLWRQKYFRITSNEKIILNIRNALLEFFDNKEDNSATIFNLLTNLDI